MSTDPHGGVTGGTTTGVDGVVSGMGWADTDPGDAERAATATVGAQLAGLLLSKLSFGWVVPFYVDDSTFGATRPTTPQAIL